MYTVSYLAFSAPAVMAGLAIGMVGLRTTMTVFGIVCTALGSSSPTGHRSTRLRLLPTGSVTSPLATSRALCDRAVYCARTRQ